MNRRRSIEHTYILYKVFSNLFFVGAVWLYFYRLFITDQQVGILDGAAFGIGLLAEVPSGALADKFGRDKLVKTGLVLIGAGFFIQVIGSSFLTFFIGQSVLLIGFSFTSGADEALFYEKLGYNKHSVSWRRLITRATQFSMACYVAAILAGGYFQTIDPRIPWYLTGISFLIAAAIIWRIKEPAHARKKQKLSQEIADYFSNIKVGFSQFKTQSLWLYVPLIVIVEGLFYVAGWGLLRLILLDRFHFSPFWGSIAVASSSLITIGILFFMHRYAEKMNEKHVITIISLTAAASLLLSIANIGHWGYIVILSLYAGEQILYTFMSDVLNKHAPEKQRATVLSVASFMRMLPYVILAPLIGYLNTYGMLQYFLIGWATLICMALLIYRVHKKRNTVLSTPDEKTMEISEPF